jgi:hypothetical protein
MFSGKLKSVKEQKKLPLPAEVERDGTATKSRAFSRELT